MSRLLFDAFDSVVLVPAQVVPHYTRAVDNEGNARFKEVEMSQKIQRRQGDRLPQIQAVAWRIGGLIDLTQFTSIRFHMVSGTTVKEGPATGDASGNLTYDIAAGDTDVAGTYSAVFIATDPTGKVETFPNGENLIVEVVASI
jgi:hypothetical protein